IPTIDITAPAGVFTPAAVGNTQQLTTTWTIANGGTTLTCNGASPFVSGDTGKSFMLANAGPTGYPYNGYLVGTLTYVSSTQVTVSSAASQALSASSELMVWGADDAPAFVACNTWARAQTSAITVTFGSGAYTFFMASGTS